MSVVRHMLLLVLAFVLQTTWVRFLEISELKPDLILLVLIYVALRASPPEATLLGFGIGFIQDIYMPTDLGLNALAKTIIGFAVSYGRTGIMADNIQVQLALVCGGVLVHDLIYYLGCTGIALVDVPFFWLRYGLGRALYTCLFGAILSGFLLARRRLFPT